MGYQAARVTNKEGEMEMESEWKKQQKQPQQGVWCHINGIHMAVQWHHRTPNEEQNVKSNWNERTMGSIWDVGGDRIWP